MDWSWNWYYLFSSYALSSLRASIKVSKFNQVIKINYYERINDSVYACISNNTNDDSGWKKGNHTEKKQESCLLRCARAAHGNFAMQIRLPTTSMYGNSGQLSGQWSRGVIIYRYIYIIATHKECISYRNTKCVSQYIAIFPSSNYTLYFSFNSCLVATASAESKYLSHLYLFIKGLYTG